MRVVAALALLLSVAVPGMAQQMATPPVPTAADSARAFVASARSDLRNLVVAQEVHYTEAGRYAPTMESLTRYRASRGNVIKLVYVANDGWTASLTSANLTGSCTIFVNLPDDKRAGTAVEKRVGDEGVPVCDTQPAMAAPGSERR